jgi:hypothetical protein
LRYAELKPEIPASFFPTSYSDASEKSKDKPTMNISRRRSGDISKIPGKQADNFDDGLRDEDLIAAGMNYDFSVPFFFFSLPLLITNRSGKRRLAIN